MASIKTRVACLEQVSKATIHRPMSDVELAVRVTHILNNPESSPVYGQLTAFMKRALVDKARSQRDVPASTAFDDRAIDLMV